MMKELPDDCSKSSLNTEKKETSKGTVVVAMEGYKDQEDLGVDQARTSSHTIASDSCIDNDDDRASKGVTTTSTTGISSAPDREKKPEVDHQHHPHGCTGGDHQDDDAKKKPQLHQPHHGGSGDHHQDDDAGNFNPDEDIQPFPCSPPSPPPPGLLRRQEQIDSSSVHVASMMMIRGCPGAHAIGGRPSCATSNPSRRSAAATAASGNDPASSPSVTAAAGTSTSTSTTTPLALEGFLYESQELVGEEEEVCHGGGSNRQLESFATSREDDTTGINSSMNDLFFDIEEAQAIVVMAPQHANPHSEQGGGGGKEDNSKLGSQGGGGKRRKWILLGGVWLVSAAVVIVTILMIMVYHNRKNNQTNSTKILEPPKSVHVQPSPSESKNPYYPPFQQDLPAATLKAILQEGGPPNTTPEYKANIWMWNDPYLKSYTKERQRVRFALVSIYYATNGDNWFHNTHWLDYNVSECHWAQSSPSSSSSKAAAAAVSMIDYYQEEEQPTPPVCNDNNETTFVTLDLHSNNLNGTLPQSSFWLSKPKYIDLSNNWLQGQFPTFPVPHSEDVEVLILSNNSFIGQLKGEAGLFFEKLRIALTDSNRLQGNNGAVYQITPNLEILNFSSNLISGGVSPHLQHLSKLRYLGGSNNVLSGTFPTELGLMSSLQVFDYSNNQGLDGTIPSTLESLTKLVEFDISGTGFTGTFPDLLCEKMKEDLLSITANCSSVSCCSP